MILMVLKNVPLDSYAAPESRSLKQGVLGIYWKMHVGLRMHFPILVNSKR
jgi:hypothetical protein